MIDLIRKGMFAKRITILTNQLNDTSKGLRISAVVLGEKC